MWNFEGYWTNLLTFEIDFIALINKIHLNMQLLAASFLLKSNIRMFEQKF